ncbi:MAG: hypothetical protein HC833_19320 [Leptolyngbyaceae cyanobacterium RM1_406_9]|nr:hypothetical protein [Leptolyngbyaceae cyanobacterium RM1_406_9]
MGTRDKGGNYEGDRPSSVLRPHPPSLSLPSGLLPGVPPRPPLRDGRVPQTPSARNWDGRQDALRIGG